MAIPDSLPETPPQYRGEKGKPVTCGDSPGGVDGYLPAGAAGCYDRRLHHGGAGSDNAQYGYRLRCNPSHRRPDAGWHDDRAGVEPAGAAGDIQRRCGVAGILTGC